MRRPSAPMILALVLIAASAVLLITTVRRGGGGGTTPAAAGTTAASSAPAATTTTPTPAGSDVAAAVTYGDGIYLVPGEIRPGTYTATAPGDHQCYWARLRSFGDGAASIIAQRDVKPGETERVTVRSTDRGFKVSLGCTWRPVG